MKLNKVLIVIFFLILNPSFNQTHPALPVALLHGFMQICSHEDMKNMVNFMSHKTGKYARCIESGGGIVDLTRSFEDQAKEACKIISSDPEFQSDFALVSISQGGILARYIIEKCQMNGVVKRFISIGGPLAGTHQLPHCLRGVVCHILNSFADWFCYKGYVQKTFGPSGYFRVSNHLDRYKKSKSLLLKVNNMEKNYDPNAKSRFENLEKLVLVQFKRDTMITPRESAHFQELDDKHNLIDMKDTEIYKNNLFGLKTLDEANKIVKFLVDEKHCYYSWEDLNEYVIPYIKGDYE